MRWEGAAKRSEGSRAWGCKHCRGREEGIWRNRSQRWVDTEYVTASANPCSPLPRQSDASTWTEYYALMNRRLFGYQSSCRLLLLLICDNNASSWFWCIIEIIAIILPGLPLWLQRNVAKHLGVVFFSPSESILLSPWWTLKSTLRYQQWQGGYHT